MGYFILQAPASIESVLALQNLARMLLKKCSQKTLFAFFMKLFASKDNCPLLKLCINQNLS